MTKRHNYRLLTMEEEKSPSQSEQVSSGKEEIPMVLTIPFPEELDRITIIGRPKFLTIREARNEKNQRILEVICEDIGYYETFEAFSRLVEKNVKEKHLPALSVFLSTLRVWNWKEKQLIA